MDPVDWCLVLVLLILAVVVACLAACALTRRAAVKGGVDPLAPPPPPGNNNPYNVFNREAQAGEADDIVGQIPRPDSDPDIPLVLAAREVRLTSEEDYYIEQRELAARREIKRLADAQVAMQNRDPGRADRMASELETLEDQLDRLCGDTRRLVGVAEDLARLNALDAAVDPARDQKIAAELARRAEFTRDRLRHQASVRSTVARLQAILNPGDSRRV